MKLKKRKKVTRMHGRGMGTHGWGARKKHLGSGHRGGVGMSGSGKKAGQKLSMLANLYGHSYFGKQGITSRGTERRKNDVMNVGDILKQAQKYKNKEGVYDLSTFKILGEGELHEKITVKAKSASESAKAKIEKAGGKLILPAVLVARKVVVNPMKGSEKA